MNKKGIDISYWQGNIDFNKIKNDGIEFIILREGYRQTIDKKFKEYVNGFIKVGLPIVGVYHFIYALNESDALAEAKSCIKNIQDAGLSKDVIVFADFEYDTITNAKKNGITLGSKQCNSFTKIFCEYVESQGYKAGIYSNIDYYKNMYDKDLLTKYIFWLADYEEEPNYPCTFRQYSSKGKVNGINGNVDMDYQYKEVQKGDNVMGYSRQAVVDLVKSWDGKNESDGSYKMIIDLYNSKAPFPRSTKMQYGWAWCACTWSALAKKLGYEAIMPIEISCYYIIEEAKKMGCWQENDAYIPSPGDAVLYDWQDNGVGDNKGNPDHIGTIIEVYKDAGYMVVEEGNYSDSVKKRTLSINGKFIRGFITPKYTDNNVTTSTSISGKSIDELAHEVIAGKYGSGDARKKALGDKYSAVQKRVNEIINGSAVTTTNINQDQSQPTEKKVTSTCSAQKFDKSLAGKYKTTANLYLRNDAGTNKKALAVIPKGTQVNNYGYYSVSNGAKWLYIQVKIDGVLYTGFSHSNYLKR